MKDVSKFMTKELRESLNCRSNMIDTARHWNAVISITEYLNSEGYTYDEFLEIVETIIHFTHHEAELEEYQDKVEAYVNDEYDFDDDDDDFAIDIDGEDGQWFEIPYIG